MKITESNRFTCQPLNEFRTRPGLRVSLATLWTAATFALSGLPALAAEPVTISEFLTGNVGGLLDEDLESPDWLELYNSGTSAVNLAGWHLTDDTNDLTRWTFPTTNIGPKGFLIVFASGKDRAVAGAPLHTSFSLSSDGGYLALVKPDGVTIASQFPAYGEQRANYSYGIGQLTTVNKLLSSNALARVLVPSNGTLGLTWTANAFSDASWLAGTNGVGFETTVEGHAVRYFKANITVDTLAKTEGVITNVTQQSGTYATNVAVINFPRIRAYGVVHRHTVFEHYARGTRVITPARIYHVVWIAPPSLLSRSPVAHQAPSPENCTIPPRAWDLRSQQRRRISPNIGGSSFPIRSAAVVEIYIVILTHVLSAGALELR
jgi:hypothetical protein